MTFRADEARESRRESAINYLMPKTGSDEQKAAAKKQIISLINEYGPVIDSYPTWHPIVSRFPGDATHHFPPNNPRILRDYYKGLDHTILLVHGFISCPYQGSDKLIKTINDAYTTLSLSNLSEINNISDKRLSSMIMRSMMNEGSAARIEAERLEVPLYNINTETIFVKCEWGDSMSGSEYVSDDGTISQNIAIPLMLERELSCWRFAECAEHWQSMRGEFLGYPHGKVSSLFVNQETGQAMKTIWNALIKTGMFGSVMKIPK